MTSKYYLILLSCFILKQALVAQVVPPPATQTEVDAGLNRFKYVTPYTLANSGLISGPTNGVTAATATNIATAVATGIADTKQHGSLVLSNGVGTGIITNGATKDFGTQLGQVYSKNLSLNSRWVYYDDFNQDMTTPGLLPDAPTGHKYTLLTQYGNTNHIVQTNGYWSMGNTGAVYRSVHFRTNAQYGSMLYPNNFGGNFRYRKSTNGTVDGVERALTFILSTNADFVGKPPFLHVSVGASGFHVGRELSATNLLYVHPLPGNRNLQHLTNYNFSLTIVSNVLIAEIAGYQFMTYDESLTTTYKGLNVATWESTGTHTNEAWGEWDSAWAGYATPTESQLWGGPFKFGSNWVLSSTTYSDDSVQSTAASNSVVVAAGTGGITVTPSGSGGVMTYTISDDDAGGGGGGGGTNFPNINLLLGNTNLVLSAGVRKSFRNDTNGSHGINLNLAVPESGYEVTYSVSNSSGSDITVTFYTNSVAANPYDIATKTNVNTFTASASAVTEARLKYVSAGRWELERIFGPTAILKFGEGTIRDTNGVNGLDIVLSTRRYTNYASASITINCATDVTANYTNAVAANNTITLATPVIGTSGSLGLVSDGSARTLAILAPVAITWLSTNDTANATNILTTADKRSLFAWRVGMGTDGVSTNIHCWVKNQTP